LTQTELGLDRFSKEYISQIERGKTRPTDETLGWLAEQGLPGGSPRIVVAAVTVGARTTVELIEVD